MRKNVFRKIAQSICIGAIGLLAGTSLDYAYSGYGMLNNPNLWAESTTTAKSERVFLTEWDTTCTCPISGDTEGFKHRFSETGTSMAYGTSPVETPWSKCTVNYQISSNPAKFGSTTCD